MAINCALRRHEHWKSSHPRCVWEALQLLHIRFHPYILTPCWLHTMHSQSSQIIPFKHSQFRVQSTDLCRVLWAWCVAAFLLNNRRLIEKLDVRRVWCNFQKTLFDDVSVINTLKSHPWTENTEQCLSWVWRITHIFISLLKEELLWT